MKEKNILKNEAAISPQSSAPRLLDLALIAQRIRLLRGEVDMLSVDQISVRLDMIASELEAEAKFYPEPAACAEGHPI